jgi:hypothetical protein
MHDMFVSRFKVGVGPSSRTVWGVDVDPLDVEIVGSDLA